MTTVERERRGHGLNGAPAPIDLLAPPCARCIGSGEIKTSTWHTCPACSGTGEAVYIPNQQDGGL